MYVISFLLLAITVTLILSLIRPEPPDYSGRPHPEIEEMRIGGDGAARMQGYKTAGFIILGCSILLFIALMVFGVSGRHRTRAFWIWMGINSLVLLYVSYRIMSGYLDYLSTGKLTFIMGFPEPTAWMIYGIWGGGALFVILYVVGFKKFIYTPQDESVLQDIAEEYSKEGGE